MLAEVSKSAIWPHLTTELQDLTLLFTVIKAESIMAFTPEKSAWSRFSEADGLMRYIVSSIMLLWTIDPIQSLVICMGFSKSDSTHPCEWMPACGDYALCINQSSNSERTEQVGLMHDIFASMEEVILYLGEPPPHSFTALTEVTEPASTSITAFHFDYRDEDKIEIFRNRCTGKKTSKVLKDKAGSNYAFDIFCFLRLLVGKQDLNPLPAFDPNSRQFIDTKYQRNLFEGLRQLLLRPWWNRIWVIQEVVVPKTVTMVYGSNVAPWGLFVDAARWDSRNRSSPAPLPFPQEYSTVLAWFSRVILDIERNRELWRECKQSPLLPLLRRFSGRKASDDRDKVFALLSLARDQTSIVPNYSLEVPAIFRTTVLDIIKTTKSLAVLAGDLGRKDRQDLPSWVPDWSAAYNDLDRRRANNTENYSATSGCEVYMEDGKSELCYGFREYLGITGKETTEDPVKSFNEILGTTDWIAYLPDYNHGKNKPSEATCLAAIYRFYTVCGRAVGLKTHGDGVIALAGFQVDKIAFTGEVAFSDEVLLSVIYSWALLVSIHSLHPSYGRGTAGFRDAFRRTLCADITSTGSDTEGFTTRRINNDDYGLIATWFLQGSRAFLSPEILNKSWEISMIFKDNMDMGDIISYMEPKAVSPSIDAAIRSAAIRQRFFITEKGYIGLGPSAMRPGDYLHILMGGQTPFILRASGIRKLRVGRFEHPLERECFEVIGDCYTHGLMDGEAMQQWKEVADNTKHHFILQHLSQRRQDAVQKWHRRRSDLSDWERETDAVLLTEVRDCAKQRSISNEMLIKALRGVNESGGNAEAEERANLCTSNLSQWRDEISSWKESKGWWRDVGYLAALVNAAKLKILRITKEVADLKLEIDGIEAQINVWEEEAGKIIYLV